MWVNHVQRSLWILWIALSLTACQSTLETFGLKPNPTGLNGPSAPVPLEAKTILKSFCIDCHTGYHDAWLSLETNHDWQKAGLVVAGDPVNSPVTRRSKYGSGGPLANMPSDASLFTQFTPSHYQSLNKWISEMEPADLTAPVVSNASPQGNISFGTQSVMISAVTNENSQCRYDTAPKKPFSELSLTLETDSDGLEHFKEITGLPAGVLHRYFVRCQDQSNNANLTDTEIQFYILPAPPAGPTLSQLAPSGVLTSGTTAQQLSLTTDLSATCRYSTTPQTAYSDMSQQFTATSNGLSHSAQVTGLQNGVTYVFYVRCQSAAGVSNLTDALIQFQIQSARTARDVMVQYCYGCHPTWNSYTDAQFQTTGRVVAGNPLASTLIQRTRYSGFASANMPSPINSDLWNMFPQSDFNILTQWILTMPPTQTDTSPPILSNGTPIGALPTVTTSVVMSLSTHEKSQCRYSNSANTSFDNMTLNLDSSSDGRSHSKILTGLSSGQSYFHFIRCRDEQGNKNTSDYVISFSVSSLVDTTPPAMSNPLPSDDLAAGTISTSISINTDEDADCRYSPTNVPFGSMTLNMSKQLEGTLHSAQVFGLRSGSQNVFYVQCSDLASNTTSSPAIIEFGVLNPNGDLALSSNEAIRILDRHHLASVYLDLFGPAAYPTVASEISPKLSLFSGACDPMDARKKPLISKMSPSGLLPQGTTSTTLEIQTADPTVCRYASTPNLSFSAMMEMNPSSDNKVHTAPNFPVRPNPEKNIVYVKCRIQSAQHLTEDIKMEFRVYPTGGSFPRISYLSPTGSHKSTNLITAHTQEPATCFLVASEDNAQLKNNLVMISDDGLEHTIVRQSLQELPLVERLVRCRNLGSTANPPSTTTATVTWRHEGNDAVTPCSSLNVGDIGSTFFPSSSPPREGQRMKVCNVMSFNDSTLMHAISQITGISDLTNHLASNPIPSPSDIEAAYDYFNPGQTTSSAALTAIRDVAAAAQEASKPLDPWRYALLALCYDASWQIP